MTEPRDFWIDEKAERFPSLEACAPESGAFVRVVECADYTQLREVLSVARDALKIIGPKQASGRATKIIMELVAAISAVMPKENGK